MKIVLAGTVEGISTRQDGTILVKIGTQELQSSEAGSLFELRGKYCKALLTDNNIQPLEEKLLEEAKIVDGKKVKTQSQRMRATLYRCWEASGLSVEFDDYYRTETEKIISHYKAKLD